MQHEIDLSGLRDLHTLPQPDIWPLAYGWWILIIFWLLIVISVLISYLLWHNTPTAYAIRKIKKIIHNEDDDLMCVKKLSKLLRRVAIAADGRSSIAQLSDTKWQHFLQTRAPRTLTNSETHLLAFAPYEPVIKNVLDRSVLMDHTILWVKKVLNSKKSS